MICSHLFVVSPSCSRLRSRPTKPTLLANHRAGSTESIAQRPAFHSLGLLCLLHCASSSDLRGGPHSPCLCPPKHFLSLVHGGPFAFLLNINSPSASDSHDPGARSLLGTQSPVISTRARSVLWLPEIKGPPIRFRQNCRYETNMKGHHPVT